jgi:6,7-dimethyl-8-ribityllumazine synthase
MATALKNLSTYDPATVPSGQGLCIGIVTAEWNLDITNAMTQGAIETLVKHGVKDEDIILKYVPGTFELTTGCKWLAEYHELDAVIAIGTVIQGETRHFDFICQGVTHGITELNLAFDIPFIFGVLTTDNLEQAQDRAGGKHGNKGTEAAITALKMAALQQTLEDEIE